LFHSAPESPRMARLASDVASDASLPEGIELFLGLKK
jgi:hypothetical protein